MKKITVSVDDDTYRRARLKAVERDTSVSAMVRAFLEETAWGESEADRLKREEARLRRQIVAFTAGDRLSRDDLHERGV